MRLTGALLCGLACWLLWAPALAADASPGAGASASPGPDVRAVRLGRTPGRTRLVFDLTAAPYYRWDMQSEGLVLEMALSRGRWEAEIPARLFAGSPVRDLEHRQAPDAGGLHLRLLLREPQHVEVFPLDPHAGQGYRLVVDLYAPRPERTDPARESGASAVGKASASTAVAPPTRRPTYPNTAAASPRGTGPPGRPIGGSAPAWLRNLRIAGYGELSGAYTVADPTHWSQLRARVDLGLTGDLGTGLRFKLAGRAQGDAAYSLENDFYPAAVREDQRSEFMVREAYLDAGAGKWQYRLGRQHVVWGEMVGLFLADVVSARDRREFYLQEFDALRIPQWAVRAERFAGNSHLELLWIPYPSYDEIGEPGADFYPFPVPAGVPVRHREPTRNLDNTHWGLRASHLVGGWDLSAFYYQAQDVAPTLYTEPEGLVLRNERVEQLGATFSKDFYTWVLRGEAVHTTGRKFYTQGNGLDFAPQAAESLDYVLGATIPRGDWRFDLQFYGRYLFQHQRDFISDANETGFTVLVNYGFGQDLEWELLYLSGLNRSDWSLQPRMLFNLSPEWRLQVGADLFGGEPIGLFGQFDQSDRIYLELRRWF